MGESIHGRDGVRTSKLFICRLSEERERERECRNWKGDLVIAIEMRERER